MVTIYHNPRCSKSREALDLLKESKEEITVIEYLKTPPTKQELEKLLSKLGIPAEELVRKGEELYKEKYKGKKISNSEWIKILTANPVLIERPVIIKGNQAIIGRPPVNVYKIL
jgi:arsenate reductase (glutaredoxin)